MTSQTTILQKSFHNIDPNAFATIFGRTKFLLALE